MRTTIAADKIGERAAYAVICGASLHMVTMQPLLGAVIIEDDADGRELTPEEVEIRRTTFLEKRGKT